MCIGNNRGSGLLISDTIGYSALVTRPHDGTLVQVIGYGNKVSTPTSAAPGRSRTRSAPSWSGAASLAPGMSRPRSAPNWSTPVRRVVDGNAVLVMVPAVPGTMNEQSLIAVSRYPNLLSDYAKAVTPEPEMNRGASYGGIREDRAAKSPIVVKGFDEGLFDVVIAADGPSTIPGVISQVDESKRPSDLNEILYGELALAAPGWTAVLFCFASEDAARAGSVFMQFETMFPDRLYFPGLDGHEGMIERGDVAVDHTLVFGTDHMAPLVGDGVDFTDPGILMTTRPWWLVSQVVGAQIPAGTMMPQGDFVCWRDDVEVGRFECWRVPPPGWLDLPGAVPPAGDTLITRGLAGFGQVGPPTPELR